MILAPIFIALTFAMNAVVIERSGPIAAIASGFSRVFTRNGILACAAFSFAAVAVLVRRIDRNRGARLGRLAAACYRGGGVLGSLLRAAFAPFSIVLIAVYYFDVRIRREGFDLEAELEQLASAATSVRVIVGIAGRCARASAVASRRFSLPPATPGSGDARGADRALDHANPHAGRLMEHDVRTLATPPANFRALAARELATELSPHAPETAALPAADKPWWMRLWTWLSRSLDATLEGGLWERSPRPPRRDRDRRRADRGGDRLDRARRWSIAAGLAFERSRGESLELLAPPPNARALYDAACDRARQKDYAAASRLLFAAMVASPALLGAAIEDRSATVGELRRLLRQRDRTLLPPFDAVCGAFVTSVYAELPVDAIALGGGARRDTSPCASERIVVKHRAELAVLVGGLVILAALAYGRQAAARAGRLPRCIRPTTPVPTGIARSTRRCAVRALPVRQFARALPLLDSDVKTLVISSYENDAAAKGLDPADAAGLRRFRGRGRPPRRARHRFRRHARFYAGRGNVAAGFGARGAGAGADALHGRRRARTRADRRGIPVRTVARRGAAAGRRSRHGRGPIAG